MKRVGIVTLVVGTASWACSGNYEVGGVMPIDLRDPPLSGGRAPDLGDVSNEIGGALSASGGGGSTLPAPASGGTSAGLGEPTTSGCIEPGAPDPLVGPFAEPSEVWSRLAPLIWGRSAPAPMALPKTTTYEWAAELADAGLEQAVTSEMMLAGANAFVRSYLALDGDATLRGRYGVGLSGNSVALSVLFADFLPNEQGKLDERQGVFNEPDWLALHPTISGRGQAMHAVLFGEPLPPHSGALSIPMPEEGSSDRATLQQQTASAPCPACHQRIDPLGFALGHFDDAGDYRELDDGMVIDASGSVITPNGDTLTFANYTELIIRLTNDCSASLTMADAFLRFALKERGLASPESEEAFLTDQNRVRRAFVDGGRSYRALVRAYAGSLAALGP